jgi:hypothetical protein
MTGVSENAREAMMKAAWQDGVDADHEHPVLPGDVAHGGDPPVAGARVGVTHSSTPWAYR